jgi:hypothetical protein
MKFIIEKYKNIKLWLDWNNIKISDIIIVSISSLTLISVIVLVVVSSLL